MTTIKITDATSEPVTLADAKTHLRETGVSAANDAYIYSLIRVARTACEERLQRTLLPTIWERTLDCFPCVARPGIQLYRPSIISISWVKYVDTDGVLQTLDPAAYLLTAGACEPGRLSPAYGTCWPSTRPQPGAVSVRYQAGYANAAAVPTPVKQWILLALADLYQHRGRSSERPALPQDFADGLISTYEVTGG